MLAAVIGASSGLGRRLALDLTARGDTVVGCARRPVEGVAASVRLDVSDTDAVTNTLASISQEHGPLDLLVNAAAFEQPTKVTDGDLDLYRRTFETNFFGLVAATLAVVPGMVKRGSGIVVNFSSDHGRAPAPGTPAYSASKAAVSAFTESIAHEVAPSGVRLHVVYPGWVPTALGQGAVDGGMDLPPRMVRRTEAQISRLVLAKMGGPAIDINAARVATLAPVVRSLAPRLYRSQMRRQGAR
ncbi:MAG TPA: SDR family oxidoreductase [Acidimicrobiales bacterium]